ncbi:MAG: imidazoleglycerol-phosphate dehydratase HisB [Bacillota bacterium]|nr:imidazoleglycerol-phosphate dehydratase HisB [Bacillota bacterium]
MRETAVIRRTNETSIEVELNLDGAGESHIETGIGFFDHMLTQFAKHSACDINLQAAGDLEVDAHHTVEDVGIALGKCIKEALGDKAGIRRYGSALIPMDETLAECAIDLSGRSYLVFNAEFTTDRCGDFPLEMVEEFFRAVAMNGEFNLHINLRYGKNNHHMAEGIFKAFAHAFKAAKEQEGYDVLSTKGVLE